MNSTDELFRELKPDIEAIIGPLFQLSEKFIKNRGCFLPHGAALMPDDTVQLQMAAPQNDLTNSTEVLPLLQLGLREHAKLHSPKAIAIAEDVTITPDGQRATQAIKVLVEHKCGLTVALYLPIAKKFMRGYVLGDMFVREHAPEIKAFAAPDRLH